MAVMRMAMVIRMILLVMMMMMTMIGECDEMRAEGHNESGDAID